MKRKLQKHKLTNTILSLTAAFTLAASLVGHAAENTNAPAKSEEQKKYEQALAKVGKSGDWRDPDKVLTEFLADGLPINEIARYLRQLFKDGFDILLPKSWEAAPDEVDQRDWLAIAIHLRLQDVTASQVFNGMNLYFEINQTPLRWELTMNGNRPTALLRVLEAPKPKIQSKPAVQPKRAIFFVGDLIGKKHADVTMVRIVETLSEVHKMTFDKPGLSIGIHDKAELLVVTGNDDEIELIRDTLVALKEKAKADAERKTQWTPDEPKPEPTPAKTKTP